MTMTPEQHARVARALAHRFAATRPASTPAQRIVHGGLVPPAQVMHEDDDHVGRCACGAVLGAYIIAGVALVVAISTAVASAGGLVQ